MINPYLAAMFLSVTVASFSQILLKKSAMKTYESSVDMGFWSVLC